MSGEIPLGNQLENVYGLAEQRVRELLRETFLLGADISLSGEVDQLGGVIKALLSHTQRIRILHSESKQAQLVFEQLDIGQVIVSGATVAPQIIPPHLFHYQGLKILQ